MPDMFQGLSLLAARDWVLLHLPKILIIVVAAYLIDRVDTHFWRSTISALMRRGAEGRDPAEVQKRADTIVGVLSSTTAVLIYVLAGLTILSELEINIAPLLAGAGVAGIAVGFGAQSLVKDIISGLFILVEGHYAKGDVVNIAGIGGLVEDINLRRTILRDLDGTVHVIPNGSISVVSNLTRDWSRVNIDIEVAYEENLDRVIEVVNRVGKELAADPVYGPMILEPPQVLRVEGFESSGVALKVLGTTRPIKQWDVAGELRKRLKAAFDAESIEIPYPHRVMITKEPMGPPGDPGGAPGPQDP